MWFGDCGPKGGPKVGARRSRFSISCCLIVKDTNRGLNVYLRKKFLKQYNLNNSIQYFIIEEKYPRKWESQNM
jgi:hypothetical protein